jgi:uncharacterized protein
MASIQEFLSAKSIAIVGVSRNPQDYSRLVLSDFRKRGYRVYAVNPSVQTESEGTPFFARVSDIPEIPQAAILLPPDSALGETTRQCLDAGIRQLWFRKKAESSPAYAAAVSEARQRGAEVITGECPLMFLPDGAWYHRLHAVIARVSGSYPR